MAALNLIRAAVWRISQSERHAFAKQFGSSFATMMFKAIIECIKAQSLSLGFCANIKELNLDQELSWINIKSVNRGHQGKTIEFGF